MSFDQRALTVLAEVYPGMEKELQKRLDLLQGKITKAESPFKHVESIHFARLVLVDSGRDKGKLLVYDVNHDEKRTDHLEQLRNSVLAYELHQLFLCCVGYQLDVIGFIEQRLMATSCYYRGHRGLTVRDIRKQFEVYGAIQDFLDTNPSGSSALELKEHIHRHVVKTVPGANTVFSIKFPFLGKWSILPIALLLLIPVLVILLPLILFVVYFRTKEKTTEELPDEDVDPGHVSDIMSKEDLLLQNQFTHLVPARREWWRLPFQRFSLFLVHLMATYIHRLGRLGDICTIHFARWVTIKKTRSVLFLTNFDGSWENYLSDFVDRSATGLNIVWTNSFEYPRTKWIIHAGARDEERLKSWARKYQLPLCVWYSAYPDLTVKNILRNHQICSGLGKNMTGNEATDWLKLL